MVVSFVWGERSLDAPACRARTQGARPCGWLAPRAGEPARAETRVREPPPAKRGRLAGRPDAPRARRHLDDPDLYPRARGTAQEPGARPPSPHRPVIPLRGSIDLGFRLVSPAATGRREC